MERAWFYDRGVRETQRASGSLSGCVRHVWLTSGLQAHSRCNSHHGTALMRPSKQHIPLSPLLRLLLLLLDCHDESHKPGSLSRPEDDVTAVERRGFGTCLYVFIGSWDHVFRGSQGGFLSVILHIMLMMCYDVTAPLWFWRFFKAAVHYLQCFAKLLM